MRDNYGPLLVARIEGDGEGTVGLSCRRSYDNSICASNQTTLIHNCTLTLTIGSAAHSSRSQLRSTADALAYAALASCLLASD